MPRSTRTRYPLNVTISSLLIGLLVLTLAGVIGIALFVRSKTLRATTEQIQEQVTRSVVQAFRQLLDPAEGILRECVASAEAGHVPLDDPAALAAWLGNRIRYDDRFEWLGYIAADGSGGGGEKSTGEVRLLHASAPDASGNADLVVETYTADGSREVVDRRAGGLAPFKQVAWYDRGAASEEPGWTERYVRPYDGSPGRACAYALRVDGEVVGVFGVGFGLSFIDQFVATLKVADTGCVMLVHDPSGVVAVAPSQEARDRLGPVVDAAVARLPGGVAALGVGEAFHTSVEHAGVDYAVALEKQEHRGVMRWVNAVVVPADELVGFMKKYLPLALAAIGLVLLAAIVLASVVAARISRPLKVIAEDLKRVGSFELSSTPTPHSVIQEVAVVGESVDRMKASLRSFGRYVPTDLVRDLLAQGQEAKLDGRPRSLTLFFSDVKGFTSMSEGMAPQTLVDSLGAYLDVVTKAVRGVGGTIDKFMGDGVLAFFNAPRDDSDHAAHACRAALAVQAALDEAREPWAEAGIPSFLTRIGLHTDEVVVGNIGTPERFAYTVLGDGVNLAARLESVNKAYGTWILASDATRVAAGDGFEWRRVDRTAVAGKSQGVDIHELLGEAASVDDAVAKARDAYEQALDAYFDRRFEAAVKGFTESLRLRAHDLAAETLLARSEAYAKTPPPPDWNGVHIQTQK